jgi:hypothetical protein
MIPHMTCILLYVLFTRSAHVRVRTAYDMYPPPHIHLYVLFTRSAHVRVRTANKQEIARECPPEREREGESERARERESERARERESEREGEREERERERTERPGWQSGAEQTIVCS